MEQETEYTIAYWVENFIRDVETFQKFWKTMQNQHRDEYPARMSLREWDEQFVQWMCQHETNRIN
jgi:hypothetical protein